MDVQKLIVVAAYLDGWKLDSRNPHRPFLINGAGLSILVRAVNGQRWELSGSSPTDSHGRYYGFNYWLGRDVEQPQISVSHKREAAHIAADLQRRLIPGYVELHAQAKAAITKHDSALRWCDHIQGLFTNLLKGQPPYNGRTQQRRETRRRICFGDYKALSGSGEVILSHYNGGNVDINIGNLTPDLAIKLMHFYQNEIVNHEQ